MGRADRSASREPAPLSQDFYARGTLAVARELLGKVVETRTSAGAASGRIVETEAYRADDPASHSCRGETPRSAIMFGDPGVAYVYFIYGMYEMLNFVTEPKGAPGAVLIRALEPLSGIELMARRRGVKSAGKGSATKASAARFSSAALTSGPGKLCRALGITLSHGGESLRGPAISVFDDGYRVRSISVSPRVGIRVGKEALWRFFITDNAHVSRCPQNREAVAMVGR